jgi:hypothetical protein
MLRTIPPTGASPFIHHPKALSAGPRRKSTGAAEKKGNCRPEEAVVEPPCLPFRRNPEGQVQLGRFGVGSAMRRLSVWSVMRQKEGCFSPAIGRSTYRATVAWNNPTDRGPTVAR